MHKVYRVLDFDTEDTHHGIHVSSMEEADKIAEGMNDPQIMIIELTDTQSIISQLNIAAGHWPHRTYK